MVCATAGGRRHHVLAVRGRAGRAREPYPKATPPPPPSAGLHAIEGARSDGGGNRAARHAITTPCWRWRSSAHWRREIRSSARRHFTFLLPELLQIDPQRVVEDAGTTGARRGARCAARRSGASVGGTGSRRGGRLDEIAGERAEQRDAAQDAVSSLAAIDPAQAIYVADQFGIGRDDGSLEHLVQMWAEEDIDGAARWLASQPAGPRTDQLRARIEQVRRQASVAERQRLKLS